MSGGQRVKFFIIAGARQSNKYEFVIFITVKYLRSEQC